MSSMSGEGYGLHEIDGENMESMRLVGRIYSRALARDALRGFC